MDKLGTLLLPLPFRSISGPSRGQTHPQAPERRAWEARTRATSAAQLCTLLVTVVVQPHHLRYTIEYGNIVWYGRSVL